MDSKILLGKILQRFADNGISKVEGFKGFEYLRETNNSVYIRREKGTESRIPFEKILQGIEAFKANPELYNDGPSALRQYDIKFTTSPVWSLLHLLQVSDYE